MTLTQWADKYKIPHTYHCSKRVLVYYNDVKDLGALSEMFHLSDYIVTTFSCGVYWLKERSNL